MRIRPPIATVWALIVTGLLGVPLAAEEHGEESRPEHSDHQEHEHHKHHLSVFLGVTDGEIEKETAVGAQSGEGEVVTEDQRAFTLGLDYEYRLNRRWGVGALIDWAGKDFRSWVGGIPLLLHPHAGWKLMLAPGFENSREHDAEFLVRAGAMYDFELGRTTISPSVYVDFLDGEEVLVYGVNIGKGF